jgi:hypothetical protein
MAAATYGNENLAMVRRGINWGAIWAGVFTFAAIWSVFGALGMAIFASAAKANAARPVSGMNVGESIWMIVLTIIAMYVAGLITGRLAAVTTSNEGVAHGQAMFGLSVVSLLVLVAIAGVGLTNAVSAPLASTHSPYILGAIADLGWAGFVALFLGWIGAMIGGSQAPRFRTGAGTSERPVQPIRSNAA